MLQIYWRKISRHTKLIRNVTILAFLLSLFSYTLPRTFYIVQTRYIVAQDPLPITEIDEEARQYNWRTSEYIVFALKDWIDGTTFKKKVMIELISRGVDEDKLEFEEFVKSIGSSATRSQILIIVQDPKEDRARLLADSVQKIVEEQHSDFIPQLASSPAQLSRIDGDLVEEISPSLQQKLSIINHLLFAFLVGVGAAITVEMFMPRLDSKQEVERIGVTILGQIPE